MAYSVYNKNLLAIDFQTHSMVLLRPSTHFHYTHETGLSEKNYNVQCGILAGSNTNVIIHYINIYLPTLLLHLPGYPYQLLIYLQQKI